LDFILRYEIIPLSETSDVGVKFIPDRGPDLERMAVRIVVSLAMNRLDVRKLRTVMILVEGWMLARPAAPVGSPFEIHENLGFAGEFAKNSAKFGFSDRREKNFGHFAGDGSRLGSDPASLLEGYCLVLSIGTIR
jgi:hypothetical protein